MDSGNPWGLLKLVIPRIPLMVKTAILNILSLSPAAEAQGLRMEVAVTLIRSILGRQEPLLKAQEGSKHDPGIKGDIWISNCVIAAPEAQYKRDGVVDVRTALAMAIEELGDGGETYKMPELIDVEAEWTGHRSGVDAKTPRPKLAEKEQYQKLISDPHYNSDETILYLHGGAYVVMDPASHRKAVAYFAKVSHGKGFSVRYRLAPQDPFPSALLDAFVAYLSLLYPPPGSFHQPVPASSVVVSGDSAGGGLSAALILLLLTLHRIGVLKVRFHGQDIDLSLPGGFALTSPWVDVTRSMPSVYRNAKFDYLRPPSEAPSIPPLPLAFKPDEIWPARPPRVELYCEASTVLHPLVSPVAASKELWEGHPPAWISTGGECLQDEDVILGSRLTATGKVVFELFDGMPHVFAFIFPQSEWRKVWFKSFTDFCGMVTKDPESIKTYTRWWKKGRDPVSLDLDGRVLEFIGDEDEIQKKLRAGRAWRVETEREMIAKWDHADDKEALRARL